MAAPQFFRVADFSGGYNPSQNPVLLQDNQAVVCENFRLDKVGSLVSRPGYEAYNDTVLADEVVQAGALRVPASPSTSELLVHAANGTLYSVAQTGAHTALDSGWGTTRGKFLSAQDVAIYANGVQRPVAYDGTNVYDLGIAAPTTAPVASVSGVGTLDGTYDYVYTYYSTSRAVESNPSASDSVSPTVDAVSITFASSADASVDKVRIYRRDTSAGGTSYLFLAEVNDTASPYSDTGAVTPNPLLPLVEDNDQAPNLEQMSYYNGYYFGSIGRNLYWSKDHILNQGRDAWPALNVTEVPFQGNDRIVTMVSTQDALLIFGYRNIVLLVGQGGAWSLTRIDTDIGCQSIDGAIEASGQTFFLAEDGLRVFPGLALVAPQVSNELAAIANTAKRSAVLTFVPREKGLWVTVGGQTYNVHLPNQSVSIYTFDPVATVTGGVDGSSQPILCLNDSTSVYQYGAVWTDAGTDISLRWASKVFQLTNPEKTKFIRRLGAFATAGSDANVTITISDQSTSYPVVLEAIGGASDEGFLWDDADAEWDTATWVATTALQYFLASMPAQTLVGYTVQISISAAVDTETEVAPPFTILYREANRFLGV